MKDLNKSYLVYQEAFEFVVKKSQGVIPTYAAWQRNFVQNHPEYKQDGVISEKMAFEIVKLTTEVTEGTISNQCFYWEQIQEQQEQSRE